jgi:glycosyltransferase involved in cell wall biosynthesis
MRPTFVLAIILVLAAIAAALLPRAKAAAAARLPPAQKGHLVWIMHSYLPNVRAGSEITAHALNKYLVSHGWRISVLVNSYVTSSHEGIDIYPLKAAGGADATALSDVAAALIADATALCCQNYNGYEGIEIAEAAGKPILFFLHVEFEKIEILQQKFRTPVLVVYNSTTQREMLPTIHPWTVVRPHIDYAHFRAVTVQPSAKAVTLLNCNSNKGGDLLPVLARELPTYQFLGVKGAYQQQIADESQPNLRYLPTFDDPRLVYAQSRLVIMPSRAESWGRVALEAMAAGVPVIVGDTPGLRECTGGAAPVCRQTDTGCWLREIAELYEDGPRREDAVKAGLARIAALEIAPDFELFSEWLVEALVAAAETAATTLA